jgi:shikimate kinase
MVSGFENVPGTRLCCAVGRSAIKWAERGGEDMIRLIGPGGAGKTTIGALLARRLGLAFVDLDREFIASAGDISQYIDSHGYGAYARRNVEVYFAVTAAMGAGVLALSSGFMTYLPDVHAGYERCRQDITSSPSTFVLLPSLDVEVCVAETVRRQLRRPFSRSADREAHVIRTRFPIYANLQPRKVETMRPVDQVVDDIVAQHG